MIWFISDLHFGHKFIIRLYRKEFDPENTNEHDEYLINMWNEKVKDDDTVYFIGDFSFQTIPITRDKILPRLKGNKIFIKGNHDRSKMINLLKRFGEVYEHPISFEYEGKKFHLSHYPIEEWIGRRRNHIHIHGHVHDKGNLFKRPLKRLKNRYNVAYDVNKRMISIDEIIKISEKANSKNLFKKFIAWANRQLSGAIIP